MRSALVSFLFSRGVVRPGRANALSHEDLGRIVQRAHVAMSSQCDLFEPKENDEQARDNFRRGWLPLNTITLKTLARLLGRPDLRVVECRLTAFGQWAGPTHPLPHPGREFFLNCDHVLFGARGQTTRLEAVEYLLDHCPVKQGDVRLSWHNHEACPDFVGDQRQIEAVISGCLIADTAPGSYERLRMAQRS